MPKKKQTNVKIKIALISGIFLVIAFMASSYVGSSSEDTQSEESPIANISFGNNAEFPKSILQVEGGDFFVYIIMENRGSNDAKTIFTANGNNAKVRIGTLTDWSYQQTLPFTSKPDLLQKKSPLYVLPDNGASSFTVMISLETPDQISQSQEIALHHPTVLTFEKDGEQFVLIEQR